MMSFFLTYDIHFFTVLLLVLLLITMSYKGDTLNTSGKLFRLLVIFNIYMLILEIISWRFDHKPGQMNWYANYISNMLFAWSGPLISCLWVSYIDYHMYGSYLRIRKHFYFMYPMLLITLFIIINFFTPLIFSVDVNNHYSREPHMWLIILVNSLIVLYKWFDAYKHRNQINREIVIAILLYITIPSIGAIAQLLIYGAFIIWPLMAITIVVSYFFLDTISTSKEQLTGLMTRQRLEGTADYYIATKRSFTLILIDLNNFKGINDSYGHIYGDQALIKFSTELKKVFGDFATIGRYGGDEFILLLEVDDASHLKRMMKDLRSNLDSIDSFPFSLKFAYGHEQWTPECGLTYEELLSHSDKNMYANKPSH